jgi:hypothetical protein
MGEAKQQDPRLVPILESASSALREILRNAFNLWLVIHLLDQKGGVDWLYEIESEVQLFERYWRYRISTRDDAYDRWSILNSTTSEMVSSRTLSVPLADAYQIHGASRTFQSLLSDEILRMAQTNRVAYAHNILFDFSISKLLLDEQRLFGFLAHPDRSIFFRPSVSYFLALLWYGDRNAFWRVAAGFFAPDLELHPRVHVLPGMAIFNSATSKQDVEPLFALPGSTGVNMILSVLRAVQAFNGMTSGRANLWLQLICDLSSRLDITFVNEYVALVEIASRQTTWASQEKQRLALASITLLKWMWNEAEMRRSKDEADQLLSIAAGRVIPVVTRLYSADPDDVKATLRTVLDRVGRKDVSPSEAYALANNLEIVVDADPSFAVDVYEAAFAYEEKSQEKTQIGSGKVFVMTSTRAQDYSMTYYILGVRFKHFLDRDLDFAALAAVRSVTAQVRREHVKTGRRIGKYSTHFTFAGVRSKLTADRSELWDQGHRDAVSLQLLDALFNRISELLKRGELLENDVWRVLQLVAKENRFPVVWKRLIEHASLSPELLPFAVPLMQASEILAAPETTVVAGNLLSQHFMDLTVEDRRKIEAAIWAIPDLALARAYRAPEDQRDRLLACVPEEQLSDRSISAVRAAKSQRKPISNEPFFKIGPTSIGHLTDEDWLRQRGVDTSTEPARMLLDAKTPLASFQSKYLNEIPSLEDIEAILPALKEGFERVTTFVDADQHVITDVLAVVAACADSILKNATLNRESVAVQLCREIIAIAAGYPYPEPLENADESFDTPMWGSTPKVEAAQGVMHYAFNWGLDDELVRLITGLSNDKSPAVRFQVAQGLGGIYKHNSRLFWELADSMRSHEQATGVLVTLTRMVGHGYIAKLESDKVEEWLARLLKRSIPKPRSEDVFQAVFDTLMYLYIFLNAARANRLLRSFERSPVRSAKHLRIMAHSASYYLDYNMESGDSGATEVRGRAREIELRILAAVDRGFRIIEERLSTPRRGATRRAETVKQLLMTVDSLVFRLYLIIKANPQLTRPGENSLSDVSVPVFFEETAALWDAVVSADTEYRRPLGPSTAHHLMESFNRLLPINPERILKLAWRLITGRTFGYQFDQMAIGEFISFADKILSEHRELLRDEVSALHFAEILDIFVSAGWPDATRLVFRMDSAVR